MLLKAGNGHDSKQ